MAAKTCRHQQQNRLQFHHCPPNQSKNIQDLLTKISAECDRLLVIFDRFYSEEMFSFHVYKHSSKRTTMVLDMQDLHSWRRSRQNFVQRQPFETNADGLSNLPLNVIPKNDDLYLLRELASIYRSDLSLVCSSAEIDLLSNVYRVPSDKICLSPLFGAKLDDERSEERPPVKCRNFGQRNDFVFVGGFHHDPNVDGVRQLQRLWPEIRKRLGSTGSRSDAPNLHVYGAYCPEKLNGELRQRKFQDIGFFFHGYHPGLVDDILLDKRVLLSPLRFGAGIKGKLVDAWRCGLPVVTTPIGSEGMCNDQGLFGGIVTENDDDFVRAACDLYTNESQWNGAVSVSHDILPLLCGWEFVGRRLVDAVQNCNDRRSRDHIRSILWHQTNRSSEYFSKYIECKESKAMKRE